MKISGKKIKDIRTSKKMSRAELSRCAEVPVRTLEDWESGKRNPTDIDKIIMVAQALGIDICDLYSDEYLSQLNAQAILDTERFANDEECEKLIVVKVDSIYADQGEIGITKLLDRFIFHAGVEEALKIIEDYINESGID